MWTRQRGTSEAQGKCKVRTNNKWRLASSAQNAFMIRKTCSKFHSQTERMPPISKLHERPWPEGPWPLGAQYLASCSQQLWTFKNAFYAVAASSHICLLGSHTFKNYEVTGGHAGEYVALKLFASHVKPCSNTLDTTPYTGIRRSICDARSECLCMNSYYVNDRFIIT